MTTIVIFVPGPPRGKERPRFHKHAFTPAATRAAEKDIAWHARIAMRGKPLLAGALSVSISAVYSYPKSWSAKKRAATRWKTSKPDVDNIAKLIDAFGSQRVKKRGAMALGIVWTDDASVVILNVTKMYGAPEGVTYEIQELP